VKLVKGKSQRKKEEEPDAPTIKKGNVSKKRDGVKEEKEPGLLLSQ